MLDNYDIIVVGGGHAGCEAAAAAANMGSKTLLITMDLTKLGQMSCNPAMGGVAKGQIIKEIDALGGYSGIVTDYTMIQFRMLNRSKGPAMWSPRAQCDRTLFSFEWRKILETLPNLDFWQDTVLKLIVKDNEVKGVETQMGMRFYSKSIILTVGTFLNGLIHIGHTQLEGGRLGETSSYGLTEQLVDLGFEVDRMKTGTSARIDARSLDLKKFEEQHGDEEIVPFSYMHPYNYHKLKQRPCYIGSTDAGVHELLKLGLDKSPLYDGTIQSAGPRYCPSIETKLVTFPDKDSHHLFLEPEGEESIEFYINGFSSSLPWEIQLKALKQVKGLEKVKVFRPGYAIEYDYFYPTQLKYTLETKLYENLYFAGQINGTTGYEEAGAQGMIAAINAHLKNNGKAEFILQRDQAYIGVLIDDLVTKGVDEPYRMFTSRAEFRILLRQDNADIRLTEISYNLGLADEKRMERLNTKLKNMESIEKFAASYSCRPELLNPYLESINSSLLNQP
ncbi:MAG: tRNA uridine-5-carboxymethylaminomethyl(34) synthesis enzyme MnmG, partial [Bacteroidales bacterium]|nr:tRNA uridine-5-carboxymethylaminomethyl(34) synthesis enzyme MnmG [Bacteroidales bacterium]